MRYGSWRLVVRISWRDRFTNFLQDVKTSCGVGSAIILTLYAGLIIYIKNFSRDQECKEPETVSLFVKTSLHNLKLTDCA